MLIIVLARVVDRCVSTSENPSPHAKVDDAISLPLRDRWRVNYGGFLECLSMHFS